MLVAGKVVVVTGAARGIGRALAIRFAAAGAIVHAADRDEIGDGPFATHRVDVTSEVQIRSLVERVGHIDLFCSNAGIFIDGGVLDTTDEQWDRIVSVNCKAHLYAARAVLPQMLARGEGYLLQVVSAAGLLTQIGSVSYAVTKHAALALAEWIAMEHGDDGIRVSCVCPQGVRTRMLLGEDGDKESFLKAGSISAEEVAEAALRGVEEERFLILPHPEVGEYFRRKAEDYDRWLRGMRRLRKSLGASSEGEQHGTGKA